MMMVMMMVMTRRMIGDDDADREMTTAWWRVRVERLGGGVAAASPRGRSPSHRVLNHSLSSSLLSRTGVTMTPC